MILLDEAEQEIVEFIAKQRTDANKKPDGTTSNAFGRDPYALDKDGFGAEMAFCKKHNLYPDFSIFRRKGSPDCITKKGKRIDVKHTSNPKGDMLVKTTKPKGEVDIYVLMTGVFPLFHIIGFATDEEVFNAPKIKGAYTENYTLRQDQITKWNYDWKI